MFNEYTKKWVFEGTEEEKSELNKRDRKNLINFPENYSENFIPHVKKLNEKTENPHLSRPISFDISLDAPDHIVETTQNYNTEFNTDFSIQNLRLEDNQLHFSTVEVSKATLLDIFCFGSFIIKNNLDKGYSELPWDIR